MSNQPYIGLRPFERNETDIFFGREQHSDELIDRLGSHHFLAVIGTSGCGKSSLVKTGLIAGLEAGYLASAGTHWKIVELRPGQQPFKVLAEKLLAELQGVLTPDYRVESLEQALRQGSLSLHELLIRHPLPNQGQLLIVCDQFEEIFRFKQQSDAEAKNFVSLLLASSKPYPLAASKVSDSMYVVIAMRSDFLGDCAQFAGLAEAINSGLYLTPRLNPQQLRMAIEEPAFMFDGRCEPELVVKLLEDVGNNPDQLPLLQHILMRLWDLSADKKLTLLDYEKLGGLNSVNGSENALSRHADDVFNELSETQKPLAKLIFCRLTNSETGKSDTRNPTQVVDLLALTGLTLEQLAEVLKPFREVGRCFLMPPQEKQLEPESVIDISHESLIRNWERLGNWTIEEAENAKAYRRLEDRALEWQKGKAAFLQEAELAIFRQWWQEKNPTAIWARRYSSSLDLPGFKNLEGLDSFAIVEKFLTDSHAAYQKEQQAKTRQRRIAFTVLAAFSLSVSVMAWQVYHSEKRRTRKLFESRITHASLLAKGEDYLGAKQVLNETDALDKEVKPSLRHARNLLRSFTEIRGGEAELTFQGAGYALKTTAISPDGQLLAAGGEHGTLVIFDAATGQLLQRLEGHAENVEGTSTENLKLAGLIYTTKGLPI